MVWLLAHDVRCPYSPWTSCNSQEAIRRGLSVQPVGKVYFTPGASDSYVVAFR